MVAGRGGMINMLCTVLVTKEDDVYIAKDLRTNVVDEGDSLEEALNNLKEGLELYYEEMA